MWANDDGPKPEGDIEKPQVQVEEQKEIDEVEKKKKHVEVQVPEKNQGQNNQKAGKRIFQKKRSSIHLKVLKYLCYFINFVFSGLIFGWASLVLIFEKEGIFSDGCGPQGETCDSQQQEFFTMYTVSTALIGISTIPVGYLLDEYGPILTNIIAGVMCSLAIVFFGILPGNNAGFYLGGIFIAVGGIMFLNSSFVVAYLLPPAEMPLFTSVINGLFNASAVVCFFLYLIYNNLQLNRMVLFLPFGGLCAFFYIIYLFFWTRNKKAFNEHKFHVSQSSKLLSLSAEGDVPDPTIPLTQLLPIKEQSKLYQFIFLILFGSYHISRSSSFIAVLKTSMDKLGDKETGYVYTQIFSASLPCCVVAIPFVSKLLSKFGFTAVFRFIHIASIICTVIQMIPVLQIQVIYFMIYTVYRQFLFSCMAIFATHTFGPVTVGRQYGKVFFVSYAAYLLTLPAFLLIAKYANGNLLWFDGTFLVLGIPMAFAIEKLSKCLGTNGDIKEVAKSSQ